MSRWGWVITATVLLLAVFGMLFLRVDTGNNLLTNGGLEDINGTWQETINSRMQLPVGSTQLTGWQVVPPGNHGPLTRPIAVAWSKEPGSDIGPKAGVFFVDLANRQTDAPPGGIQQSVCIMEDTYYRLSLNVGTNPLTKKPASVTVTISGSGLADTNHQPFIRTFRSTPPSAGQKWEPFQLVFAGQHTPASFCTAATIRIDAPAQENLFIGVDEIALHRFASVLTRR